MNISDEQIALFEKYYHNELPANERLAFEEKCALDSGFKWQWELFEQAEGEIQAAANEDFTQWVDQQITETSQQAQKHKRLIKLIYQLAGVAAVIMLILFFFPDKSEPSLSDLIAQVNPISAPSSKHRGNEDQVKLIHSALEVYNEKGYTKTIPIINNLLQSDSSLTGQQASILYFFLGSSHYCINQLDQSIEAFQKVTGNKTYEDLAKLYLALAYLKLEKDQSTSIKLLESFLKSGTGSTVQNQQVHAILEKIIPKK